MSTQPLYKSGSLYAFLSYATVNILVYHVKASSVYFKWKKTIILFFHLKKIIYFYNLSLIYYNFNNLLFNLLYFIFIYIYIQLFKWRDKIPKQTLRLAKFHVFRKRGCKRKSCSTYKETPIVCFHRQRYDTSCTYTYIHSESNQERSRMNRLIVCALCAGEIKKVDFQVDASVNASASNFPISIPNLRTVIRTRNIIIAICFLYSRPKIGRFMYVQIIIRCGQNVFVLFPRGEFYWIT